MLTPEEIAERIEAAKQNLRRGEWKSDPDLRAQVEWLLAMPPIERLRSLEAVNEFLAQVRPVPRRSES